MRGLLRLERRAEDLPAPWGEGGIKAFASRAVQLRKLDPLSLVLDRCITAVAPIPVAPFVVVAIVAMAVALVCFLAGMAGGI